MRANLKRIIIIAAVLMTLLSARLAYIQLAGHEELSAATREQSLISLQGSNTRGIIYDINGSPLVADSRRYIYIIKKENFSRKTEERLKNAGAERVNGDNGDYLVYSSENYRKKTGSELIKEDQAYILEASARYSDKQAAAHLIGYVNRSDQSGAAGLELMFDEQLSGLNRRLYAVADVKGSILPGRGLLITSDNYSDSSVKEGIRTTVDREIQEAVENIIEGQKKDCAVVILNARTGGVTAMACTPGFNPNDINEHLDGGDDELVNKATQGEYPPGSVFKIVVAAAALEEGIEKDRAFTCSGGVNVEGIEISCETGGEGGHGEINMEEAFAGSCNSYFIRLGEELGWERISEAAWEFHLGEKALEGYPQEKSGRLMTEAESRGAAIGNLSIGQGQTLTTPLQVARMTNIIASGGIDRGVHILAEEEEGEERVLSENTAEELGGMMEKTVKEGTAAPLEMTDEGDNPEAAVKTGTAQYGSGEHSGTHGWITGYAPCEEPEYTITVFVEDGESGTKDSGPVFRDIVRYLKKSGNYSMPTLA